MSGERNGAEVSWHRMVKYRVAGGRIVEGLYDEDDEGADDTLVGRLPDG